MSHDGSILSKLSCPVADIKEYIVISESEVEILENDENMFIGLSLQQSWRVWEELRNTGKFYVVFEPRRFEDLLES